jgi:hypothetical protein
MILLGCLALGFLCSSYFDGGLLFAMGSATLFLFAWLGFKRAIKRRAVVRRIRTTAVSKKAAAKENAAAKAAARAIKERVLLAKRYLAACGDARTLAQFKVARRVGVSEGVLRERARNSGPLRFALGIFSGLLAAETVNAALRSDAQRCAGRTGHDGQYPNRSARWPGCTEDRRIEYRDVSPV